MNKEILKRAQIYFEKGNFSDLESFIEKHVKTFKEEGDIGLELSLFRINSYLLKGNYKNFLKIVPDIIEKCLKEDKKKLYIKVLLIKAECLCFIGKFQESKELMDKIEIKINEIESEKNEKKELIGKLEKVKGRYFLNKGKPNKSLEHLSTAERIFNELNLKLELGIVQNLIACAYWQLNHLDKAFNYLDSAVSIFEDLNNKHFIGICLNNMGILKSQIGDYDMAIQNFKLAKVIYEKSGDLQSYAKSINNLGLTYLSIGDIKRSKRLIIKSMEINKKIKNLLEYARSYINLGHIFRSKGDLSNAIKRYNECIKTCENIGSKTLIGEGLFGLILCYIDSNKFDHAKKALSQLKELSESVESESLKTYYKISLAYCLKEKDEKHVEKAIEILKGLIEDPTLFYSYKIFCRIIFFNINLKKWILNPNSQLLHELKVFANQIKKESAHNFSFLSLIYSYLMLSDIALLEGNFKKVKINLKNAEIIVKHYSVKSLRKLIKLKKKGLKKRRVKIDRNKIIKNIRNEVSQMLFLKT